MADVQPNLSKIIKRLELIKGLIALKEADEIESHIAKLEQEGVPDELTIITGLLKEKQYSKAVTEIELLINAHKQVGFYVDPEIEALDFEAKTLETEIQSVNQSQKSKVRKTPLYGVLCCGIVLLVLGSYLTITDEIAIGYRYKAKNETYSINGPFVLFIGFVFAAFSGVILLKKGN